MELIFAWAALVWLVVVAATVAVALWWHRRRRARAAPGIPIAHGERLTALPAYRRALLRYTLLVGGMLAVIALLVGTSAALTSRPATVTLTSPELQNRDIVLCLDVSGSMIEYDAVILQVFSTLAEEFTGERISLVVFNASAVTYFPLTSDYSYIEQQLARLDYEFEQDEASYYSGTLLGNGSSLVGDGLASCVTKFDRTESERSRSVILVTDNFVAGEQIFSLPEAAQLAADRDVRVYGINPGDSEAKEYLQSLATEFRDATELTGGAYYPLDDPAVVPSVVSSIESQQAALIPGAPQVVRTEHPEVPIGLAIIGLAGLLLLGWRLKR